MTSVTASDVSIREVRAGDEPAIMRLLDGLDSQSRYLRWFTGGVNVPEAADWAAHPEGCSAVGLLALVEGEPVGHAVLVPAPDGRGELAFEVAAAWRHHGIAGTLLQRLVDVAKARGLHHLYAEVLTQNADMLAVLREHGEHTECLDGGVMTLTLPVSQELAAGPTGLRGS